MTDWKKELIDFKSQVRAAINLLENLEQQIQKLIDGFEIDNDKIPDPIQSYIKSAFARFTSQIETRETNLSEKIESIKQQIEELKNNSELNPIEKTQLSSKSDTFSSNQNTVLTNTPSSSDRDISDSLSTIVNLYNHNIIDFINLYQDQIFDLDITQNSIEMLVTNPSSSIILSNKSPRGKFWGLNYNRNGNSYLFPNPKKLQISEHNLNVVRALFFDSNYRDGYEKIHLAQPAKIVSLQPNNTLDWKLIEKGTISFI